MVSPLTAALVLFVNVKGLCGRCAAGWSLRASGKSNDEGVSVRRVDWRAGPCCEFQQPFGALFSDVEISAGIETHVARKVQAACSHGDLRGLRIDPENAA